MLSGHPGQGKLTAWLPLLVPALLALCESPLPSAPQTPPGQAESPPPVPPPDPAPIQGGSPPVPASLPRFPLRGPPVDYFAPADNALTRFVDQVVSDKIRLPHDPRLALPTVLDALGIAPQSQWLVFARNAAQARLISPSNPRAVYFHDSISVAYTPGSQALEFSVVDPRRGPLFYSLRFSSASPPRLTRDDNCLACHVSEHTRQVPGFPLRSFITDPFGKPRHGWSGITDRSPFSRRWGGFYVTGDAGAIEHLGNLASAEALARFEQTGDRVHEVDLQHSPAVERHLRATSDVVPLLLHDHQAHFLTLATRVAHEAAHNAPLDSVPEFVQTLLLVDQPRLPAPIQPDPQYRHWFESQPSRVTPSLRRLDLRTRLLESPCSWLVESPLCRELPPRARHAIHRYLQSVLENPEPAPSWPRWSSAERKLLAEILLEQIFPLDE